MEKSFFGMSLGAMMCLLSVMRWFLAVCREIMGTLHFGDALLAMRGGATRIQPTADGEGLEIISISQIRLCWGFVIIVGRLTAACVLLYIGGIYLVYTVSMEEMLLNAVAL